MLKRSPSIALRAAAIFVSIYLAIFVGMLVLMSRAALGTDASFHAGSNIALSYAAADLQRRDSEVLLSNRGDFADLAARNRSLWLLGTVAGQPISFGAVPPNAAASFDRYSAGIVSGRFTVLGLPRPLSASTIRAIETPAGRALLAAGGVDPSTLAIADVSRFFVAQGLLPLLILGAIGLAAIGLALPALTAGLQRLTVDVARICPEEPEARLTEVGVPRELMPVVRGFNSALERLAGELTRRKRFIADVAHELRTPLAIASLQVEALADRQEKKGLQRVITRMGQLVSQMLDVERLSLARPALSRIDLSGLAADIIADMDAMSVSCGYELSLEAPAEPVFVFGDPNALGRAIANLIGNAVAHGSGEGVVKVLVSARGTLDVVDTGPGVPISLRDTLFEPFSRGRWDRDGCGLGLHLTREIMRAHGGEVMLLDSKEGATFQLQLPTAQGSTPSPCAGGA